jgi:tetratricopeptide (TPR) repeat protein
MTSDGHGAANAAPISLYQRYASDSMAAWRSATNARIRHLKLGTGTILGFQGTAIQVRFDSEVTEIISRSSSNVSYIATFSNSPSYIPFRDFVLSLDDGQQSHESSQKEFDSHDSRGIEERHLREEKIRKELERHEEVARFRQEAGRRRQETEQLKTQQFRDRVEAFEKNTGFDWNDATYHFWQLASLYNVPLTTFEPDCEAYEVLVRLDAGYELQRHELDLLAFLGAPELKDRLLRIRTLETEYSGSGNPWRLTTISGLWNESGRPDWAMQTTGRVLTEDHTPFQPLDRSLLAALLTTRGASLRRLLRREEARQCAMRAIGLDPESFYPHCLLGGIEIDEQRHDAGDASFTRCEELGGGEDSRVAEAKRSSEFAAYLFNKGYSWAWKYIRDWR